jgi:hypothetical protein
MSSGIASSISCPPSAIVWTFTISAIPAARV